MPPQLPRAPAFFPDGTEEEARRQERGRTSHTPPGAGGGHCQSETHSQKFGVMALTAATRVRTHTHAHTHARTHGLRQPPGLWVATRMRPAWCVSH